LKSVEIQKAAGIEYNLSIRAKERLIQKLPKREFESCVFGSHRRGVIKSRGRRYESLASGMSIHLLAT